MRKASSSRDAPMLMSTMVVSNLKIKHVRVTGFTEEADHTMYSIRCDAGGLRFKVKQRFKAFLALHEVRVT